jgi:hypothetical protein
MPAIVWIALVISVVSAGLLCIPSVGRRLSRAAPAREPPEHPEGLHIGTLVIPVSHRADPSVIEATGRLVRVRAISPGRWVFTLRHTWISADLGLPAAGMVVDGSVTSTPDGARVEVFTPFGTVVLIAVVLASFVIVSLIGVLSTPSVETVAYLAIVLTVVYLLSHTARRAVILLAHDAVGALQEKRVPLPEWNGVEQRDEADEAREG